MTAEKKSIAELRHLVMDYLRENPNQRVGQAYANVLHKYDPVLSHKIHAGPADPFYSNSNLAAFFEACINEWGETFGSENV